MTKNVFDVNNVVEKDVRDWQEEKGLTGVPDHALVQLYKKVVLKEEIKPPLPTISIEELWDKIRKINAGQEDRPGSGNLWYGFKDCYILSRTNTVPYVGCPICFKGKNSSLNGADYCTNHEVPQELEQLAWTEWYVTDDSGGNFVIKFNPKWTKKYSEEELVGATAWVEGNINLQESPYVMMVRTVRNIKSRNVVGGDYVDDEIDRSDVDISGFDDEEDEDEDEMMVAELLEEEKNDENPFLELEENNVDKTSEIDEVGKEFRDVFKKLFSSNAKTYVGKKPVEKWIVTWFEDNYPDKFSTRSEILDYAWKVSEGLYKFDDSGDKVKYKG